MNDRYELFKVLQAPMVTEKATLCKEWSNQVFFEVDPTANKKQIKAAVEKMFSVKVESVQTMRMRGKVKSFRGQPGKRKDWKKAVVRLAEGQSIDFFENS